MRRVRLIVAVGAGFGLALYAGAYAPRDGGNTLVLPLFLIGGPVLAWWFYCIRSAKRTALAMVSVLILLQAAAVWFRRAEAARSRAFVETFHRYRQHTLSQRSQ